jgi:hypothetical protein
LAKKELIIVDMEEHKTYIYELYIEVLICNKTNKPLLLIARSTIKIHGSFTFGRFGKCIFMHPMSNLVIYFDGQLQQNCAMTANSCTLE